MNNEFKKLSQGNITRYVLENASGGGTSSGSVASVSMPIGGMQRRKGDNLIAQESDKKKVPASTPRNFVAKNAKSSGAGAHKDKKKDAKQGNVKHKKPFMENSHPDEKEDKALIRKMVKRQALKKEGYGMSGYDTYAGGNHGRGVAENPEWYNDEANSMSSSQLKSLYKHAMKLRQAVQKMQAQGDTLEPWQQSKVTKAADYLDAVFNAVDDEHDMGEEKGVAEGADDKFSAADKVEELVDQYRLYDKRGWTDLFANLAGRQLAGAEIHTEMEYASKFLNLLDSIRMRSDYRGQQDPRKDQELIDLSNQWLSLFNKATGEFKGMSGEQGVAEEWSKKYKSSINCSHPKGFSQKAHCAGKKKHTESMMTMEATCPDCGMCQTHGNLNEIAKGAKDSNGVTKCWPGKHAVGTKTGKNGGPVRNCKPNEDIEEGAKVDRQAKHITASMMKKGKSKKDAESIAWAHIKHPKNESVDPYFESLDVMLERQLEPTMDLDTWVDNFQNADPNKYHQFKNKTPEKKK